MEVLEGLDRTLRVQHEGGIIPSQEAPPCPGLLRSLNGGAPQARDENGWKDKYAQLAATSPTLHGANGPRHPVNVLRRKPNRRQREWWKAIHRAKLQGVSSRGIARNLGMSRNTVRKYLAAETPEMVGAAVSSRRSRPATMADDMKGQNR